MILYISYIIIYKYTFQERNHTMLNSFLFFTRQMCPSTAKSSPIQEWSPENHALLRQGESVTQHAEKRIRERDALLLFQQFIKTDFEKLTLHVTTMTFDYQGHRRACIVTDNILIICNDTFDTVITVWKHKISFSKYQTMELKKKREKAQEHLQKKNEMKHQTKPQKKPQKKHQKKHQTKF